MAKTQRTSKRASKKNGKAAGKNGTSKNGTRKKTVGPRTKKVVLSDAEKGEIAPLSQKLRELKAAMADTQLNIMRLESKRLELAEAIMKLDSALMDKAKGTAESHGIDLNDPSKGRWNLDTEGGVFTRVE